MKPYLNKSQQSVIDLGIKAFDDGVLFEDNPFGNGELQNKSLWAAGWVDRSRGMTDLWQQAVYKLPGLSFRLSDYNFLQAKTLLVMWFANEMKDSGTPLKKPPECVIDPISGEKYTVRPSTKEDMSMDETAQFIEWMYATGEQLRIRWSEPKMKGYDDYPEANK